MGYTKVDLYTEIVIVKGILKKNVVNYNLKNNKITVGYRQQDGNLKFITYNSYNFQIINNSTLINLSNYIFKLINNNKKLYNIKTIRLFNFNYDKIFVIVFSDNTYRIYERSELSIEKNMLSDKTFSSLIMYYAMIDNKIGIKTDTGTHILEKRLKK